jgi:hypothetical protein
VPATDASGRHIYECGPNATCLSDAFPQTNVHTCTPGFPGWLCTQPLGCQVGQCTEWSDSAPGFRTCAAPCTRDEDCVPYDRNGNPNAFSKFMCHQGACRSLQSLLFPDLCLREGDNCPFDDQASCELPNAPTVIPDLGATSNCASAAFVNSALQPLGAFGGTSANCVRHCTSDDDCAQIAARAHVPHTCIDLGKGPVCIPSLPTLMPCNSASTCMGDLVCEGFPGAPWKMCVRHCSSDDECSKDPVLGSGFVCIGGLCGPRLPSGCPLPQPQSQPSLCLSGNYDTARGRCVSPEGWSCDDDMQCQSGRCSHGRCSP